jgi:hypothetical protein
MIHDFLKPGCDLLAALLALGAAAAWFQAALAPTPFINFLDSSNPDAVRAAIESYNGFVKGHRLNKRAALLAGLSALATSPLGLPGSLSNAVCKGGTGNSDKSDY